MKLYQERHATHQALIIRTNRHSLFETDAKLKLYHLIMAFFEFRCRYEGLQTRTRVNNHEMSCSWILSSNPARLTCLQDRHAPWLDILSVLGMHNICIGQQLTILEMREQPLTVVVPPLCISTVRSKVWQHGRARCPCKSKTDRHWLRYAVIRITIKKA